MMQSKGLFPKFWQRQQDGSDTPETATSTEAPVNQPRSQPAEFLTSFHNPLLPCEDIYHAAGILNPGSGYGVHKVVEMLNSNRIRDLSPDIKRASVLMALEAAGISREDLLRDTKRRQKALNSYEAGQEKRLEEFEARKTQENACIQAEMERITAHYADRLQQNREQTNSEREALRIWQIAKQHESQCISEVIDLCSNKAPAHVPPPPVAAATPLQPSLVAKAAAGH